MSHFGRWSLAFRFGTGDLARTLAFPAMVLLMLCAAARPAAAQTVNFNYFAAPTFVADTGESEVLGEIILTADITCGTNADLSCVSSAGSIQATFNGMKIDNTTATGITVCEIISTVTTCNAAGTYLTGSVTIGSSLQGDVVSLGVKAGANFAAGDQVRISGVRGRIAESALATPGMAAVAVLTAAPVISAGFAPTSAVVARSADPLAITLVGDPLVPCVISDPSATLEISEQFTTAFVDQGDPSESTYPGQPANARPAFGATNSTRINIVLAGLVPGITIHWPASVPAVSGNAVLDLVSQAADGSSAVYAFGTPNQAASDVLLESFDITLTSANFSFSGNGPITGDVTLQAQLFPPATPTNVRPRYNHPLGPLPPFAFLALRRCNTTTGTLTIKADVDGLGWNGAVSFDLFGPTPVSGDHVPLILEGMTAGTYSILYNSGGPSGATFSSYTPAQSLNLAVGGTRVFTLDFTGPTIANLQLAAAPLAVCNANNTAVGTLQFTNATGDTQIIAGGTTFNFTFSSPVVGAPTLTGLGSPGITLSGANMSFTVPGSISLQPGATLTLTGTKLNLTGVASGQNVTAQFTSVPSGAIHLASNQVTVATTNSQQCQQPPPPTPSFNATNLTNAASFQQGLTPGSIATLFGTHLSNATGINLTSGLPLVRQFLGVSLTLNGIQAPLFAIDNVNGQEQINFQVPWELAGQRSADVIVNNNGQSNSPVTVNLQLVSPGIFTSDGVNGAILHGVGSAPVTSASPASRGEVVVLFLTGLGAVSNTPATGSPALASPQSNLPSFPSVTVGGLDATVQFAGLAPGFVGLYQVNVQLPANVPSGNQDLVVQFGGQSSQTVKIPIR